MAHDDAPQAPANIVELARFRSERRAPPSRSIGAECRSCLPPATPMDAIDHAIASLRRGDLVEWELELIRIRYLAEIERRCGGPKNRP